MEKEKKAIVWFRNDLRLHDNEALCEALANAVEVIPIYVFDERIFRNNTRFGFPKTNVHRSQFIIESVQNLRENLQKRGSNLLVRIGKPEEIIPEIAREEKTSWVYCNRERTTEEVHVQDTMEENLWSIGQEVRYSRGKMLYYTADLPFPVTHTPDLFTNFRKEVEKYTKIREPFSIPQLENTFLTEIEIGTIPQLSQFFEDTKCNTHNGYVLKGGEDAAIERLNYYFSNNQLASKYYDTRNESRGMDYSTKFSAYLSSGCLSPKYVYKQLKIYEQEHGENKSTYWIFFELLWRDFFRLIGKKYKEKIFLSGGIQGKAFKYITDENLFKAWRDGMTGFPFVDACMRQLKATGFMSNRGRQNTASFLIHDLGLNWQLGASYFESYLIDYDPCSNFCNWNYIAGIGNDSREYRKFNVVLQSKKYETDGVFIKEWVPELAQLDSPQIHFPAHYAQEELNGLVLGRDYPKPIIEGEKQAVY